MSYKYLDHVNFKNFEISECRTKIMEYCNKKSLHKTECEDFVSVLKRRNAFELDRAFCQKLHDKIEALLLEKGWL